MGAVWLLNISPHPPLPHLGFWSPVTAEETLKSSGKWKYHTDFKFKRICWKKKRKLCMWKDTGVWKPFACGSWSSLLAVSIRDYDLYMETKSYLKGFKEVKWVEYHGQLKRLWTALYSVGSFVCCLGRGLQGKQVVEGKQIALSHHHQAR